MCGEKIQKMKEPMGNVSKHGPRFWHDVVNHGLQKSEKTAIFLDALFLQFPQDLLKFSDMGSYSKRPKRHWGPIPNTPKKALFFTRGPVPKVLTKRWTRS